MDYIGTIMTPDQIAQAAQIAQSALEAPLNTLVAIIAILSVAVSVVVVGSVLFSVYKFGTPLLEQYQQQLDTNKRLADIAAENTKQMATRQNEAEKQTNELAKQTISIEAQTTEIKSQSLDFRNYQTLVSDNMSSHSAQIEANTAETKANTANIISLQRAMDAWPDQLIKAVRDELACASLIKEFQALRYEVSQVLNQQQAKRITGTIPSVPSSSPTPQPGGSTG